MPLSVAHRLIGIRTKPMNRAKVSAPTRPKMFENGPPQDAMNLSTRIARPAIKMFPTTSRSANRMPKPPLNAAAPTPCATNPGSAIHDNHPMNMPRKTSRCMSSFGRHAWKDAGVRPWRSDPTRFASIGAPFRNVVMHMKTNHRNINTDTT